MKKICAGCGRAIGGQGGLGPEDETISHGICPACADAVFPEVGIDLGVFLDRFKLPILVVDAEGMVRSANLSARAMLGKEQREIADRPGGEVFECVHARSPEGCGNTVHCSGCTIRRAVMHTAATGAAILRQTARLESSDGTVRHYTISTERRGETVLLQVDDVREGCAKPGPADALVG